MKQLIRNKAKVAVVKNSVQELIAQKIISRSDKISEEEKYDAFYVGDMGDIVRKHKLWTSQLPRVEPFYAVKCNDDMSVLAVLAHLGLGFDCASKGEIQKVLDLQVEPSRIIYANPCKQSSFIKYAAANGIDYMTFDNETELHKIKSFHPNAKLVIRLLPPASNKCECPLGMKFGCLPKKVSSLLRVARELDLDVVGVSFHVGSGCYDAMAYSAAVASARTVFSIAKTEGFHFNLLDIGGGFPGQANAKLSFEEICSVLRPALDTYFPESMNVRIIAEPGRFYVASAFTLVLNVIARRVVQKGDHSPEIDEDEYADDSNKLVEFDGNNDQRSFMYYLNDGVYGSFNCILYDHAVVECQLFNEKKYETEPRFLSSLWGPTCDGLDCIIKECALPELDAGDWLVFNNMGAYTMSAASTFNGMPKPKCYHVMHESMWYTFCLQTAISNDLCHSQKFMDGPIMACHEEGHVITGHDSCIEDMMSHLQEIKV